MAYGLRPHFGSSRAAARVMYCECFRRLGSLYGSDVEAEVAFIREDCEALGVPMGYGRLGKAPEVLTDDLPVLFRYHSKA